MPIGDFPCSLEAILLLIGGKWKPLIVYRLRSGPLRYGALRRAVGRISDKMLIQQLKELMADELVIRRDHAELPPRVEYALSGTGLRLGEALAELGTWGTSHAAELEPIVARKSASMRTAQRRSGLAPAANGRALEPLPVRLDHRRRNLRPRVSFGGSLT